MACTAGVPIRRCPASPGIAIAEATETARASRGPELARVPAMAKSLVPVSLAAVAALVALVALAALAVTGASGCAANPGDPADSADPAASVRAQSSIIAVVDG